jgi:hypothetical protein
MKRQLALTHSKEDLYLKCAGLKNAVAKLKSNGATGSLNEDDIMDVANNLIEFLDFMSDMRIALKSHDLLKEVYCHMVNT